LTHDVGRQSGEQWRAQQNSEGTKQLRTILPSGKPAKSAYFTPRCPSQNIARATRITPLILPGVGVVK
ncbi:MAG: hypothetical protein M3P00_11040, partial [Gemmatimonadota bacterium]|nr:hypothetical protein [Gemmatimonadota bacterium]